MKELFFLLLVSASFLLLAQSFKKVMTRKIIYLQCARYLNRIPHINSGGCLIAAYSIFLFFKKHYKELFNDQFVIVQLSSIIDDVTTNKMFLNNETDQALASTHFGISFNGGRTCYDSKGRVFKCKYKYTLIIPHEDTERFVRNSSKAHNWNHLFDRDYFIPRINKKFNIKLKI